jgi:hypothetical protein
VRALAETAASAALLLLSLAYRRSSVAGEDGEAQCSLQDREARSIPHESSR